MLSCCINQSIWTVFFNHFFLWAFETPLAFCAFIYHCMVRLWHTVDIMRLRHSVGLMSLLCDDRTDFVLNDDVGLNPETEGRRRIPVLSLICRAPHGISAATLNADRPLSTFTIGWNSSHMPSNIYVLYTLSHAVLPLLMLQFYWAGIILIYSVHLVGDGWDEGED